jgi:hypothetical protein
MTLTTISSSIARDRRERAARASTHGDARERRPRGRIAALVGGAVLATAMLTNLVLADPESTELQLYARCSQVYHPEACRCAVGSIPPSIPGSLPTVQQSLQLAAANSGSVAGRVEAHRIPIQVTRDFVQLVQACMSRGSDAPAD